MGFLDGATSDFSRKHTENQLSNILAQRQVCEDASSGTSSTDLNQIEYKSPLIETAWANSVAQQRVDSTNVSPGARRYLIQWLHDVEKL